MDDDQRKRLAIARAERLATQRRIERIVEESARASLIERAERSIVDDARYLMPFTAKNSN